MKSPTIGIKLADGSFYSVMEESSESKKRMVLTAAKEDQPNVRIDLYRGFGSEMSSARKIGSLSVENPKDQGSGDIEFLLFIDKEGQLTAQAGLTDSDERQTLSLSLEDYQDQTWDGEEEVAEDEEVIRSDLDILNDESLLDGEELDDVSAFNLDETTDEPRSDQEILEDDSLAADGLDEFTLDDLTLDDDFSPEAPEPDLDLVLEDETKSDPRLNLNVGVSLDDGSPQEDFTLEDLELPSDSVSTGDSLETEESEGMDALTEMSLDDDEFTLDALDTPESPAGADAESEPLSAGAGDSPEEGALDGLADFSLGDDSTESSLSLDDDFSVDDLDAPESPAGADAESEPLSAGAGDSPEEGALDGLDDFSLGDDSTESSLSLDDDFSIDDLESSSAEEAEDLSAPSQGLGDMDSLDDLSMDDDFSVPDDVDLSSPVGDLPGIDDLGGPNTEPSTPSASTSPQSQPPANKKEPAAEPVKPIKPQAIGIPKINKFPMIFSMITLSLLIASILFLLVFNMLRTAAVPPLKISQFTSERVSEWPQDFGAPREGRFSPL